MSIKEQMAKRAATRAERRALADKIVKIVCDELEKQDEALQDQTLRMVLSELQIATRRGPT